MIGPIRGLYLSPEQEMKVLVKAKQVKEWVKKRHQQTKSEKPLTAD